MVCPPFLRSTDVYRCGACGALLPPRTQPTWELRERTVVFAAREFRPISWRRQSRNHVNIMSTSCQPFGPFVICADQHVSKMHQTHSNHCPKQDWKIEISKAQRPNLLNVLFRRLYQTCFMLTAMPFYKRISTLVIRPQIRKSF